MKSNINEVLPKVGCPTVQGLTCKLLLERKHMRWKVADIALLLLLEEVLFVPKNNLPNLNNYSTRE